ncbi:hypothetical protein SCP_0412570 [Sparassis crispa]|uniref:Uncharacterized protein n=1 Tax=Sparassis crispa TaxID=139825 RepID=A0A401GL34_9APHY|nr:hypothetical protein SCP_0412570 [Sparassis crispa]GBE82870.1 hypothetical protein SCP_0412570 [Sparassis crispa]
MVARMHADVVDKTLTGWILPDFTTTTADKTVCSALTMMTLKRYFAYSVITSCATACGIPSVILEGEKDDWLKLLQRVDKLDEFGNEPRPRRRCWDLYCGVLCLLSATGWTLNFGHMLSNLMTGQLCTCSLASQHRKASDND